MVPKNADGKPKLSGLELFTHMVKFRNVNNAKFDDRGKPIELEPTPNLDVEISAEGLGCIQPSDSEYRCANILTNAIGDTAIKKLAKRTLNNIGNVIGLCTVVNSDKNMARMKERLEMEDAMAEIVRVEAAEKAGKEKESLKKHEEKGPGAGKKLEKFGRKVDSLTVP